jgi:inosine-uridine nucleoside N-ribohydrolase
VHVETAGRWTRGETVTDLKDLRRSPWSDWPEAENARVALEVQAATATERIVERLRTLVETRA